jgi:DNA-binding SARP family transcriptional activator/WD40 repeat protein
MRIAVLGPLEVLADDDAPVEIPGAKERLLLGVLAADAGRVVSTDRIVESLWNGDPPPSARKSLQAHLVHLRTALEPNRPRGSTGRHVVRRGAGYALDVARDDLDALRLGDLTTLGRARLASGRARDAIDALTEAIDLWRGEPYADWPDAEFAVNERRRLGELRASAVDALLEARLLAGQHAELVPELERLVGEEPLREDWWRLLMLALYRAGRQADALAVGRRARAVLAAELGADPGPALRAMEAAVLAQDPALDVPLSVPAGAATPARNVGPADLDRCPYLGLAAYQPADAALFHGRRRLVRDLVGRLVDSRLLVVSGPSGAGKSSVVRAGLAPALAAGALSGSQQWAPFVLTPGAAPVDALAELTGEHQPEAPVLLVCDQLEELWTSGADEGERRTFFDTVLGLLDDGIAARCVAVVRGDHLGRLAEHAALTDRLGGALVLVPPLTDPELREVVGEPAAAVGLRVEPELVDAVVADVLGRPGALPLLSAALVGTWERRRGDLLTLAGYVEAGGVAGALTRSAEAAYESLHEEARASARRLLVRLADVDDGGALVRRRVPLAELDLDVGRPGSLRSVLEAFVARRLLSVDGPQVEVTHEALLTAWPRLARWLEDDATGRAVRRHLAPAARDWDGRGRPEDELYRGARLAAALDWAAAAPLDLAPVEEQFLEASRNRAEGELRAARERVAHETRARRRTRRLAVGLAAGLVVALVATGLAVRSSRDARAASLVADAGRLATLAATTDVADVSLLLAVQAMRFADLPETRSTLLSSVVGYGRVLRVAALPSAIGRVLLGSGDDVFVETRDGELFTWSPSDAEPRASASPEGEWFGSLDASPSDAVLLGFGHGKGGGGGLGLRSPDGSVRELAGREELGGEPLAASFTADGARAVVVVGEGERAPPQDISPTSWRLVELDVADGSRRDVGPPRRWPGDGTAIDIDIDDDGRSVVATAVGSSTTAELLRVADGRGVPLRLAEKDDRTSHIVALPAGAAQILPDGEVTIYGADGRPTQTLGAVMRGVADVVVSPDGTWAATVGSAGAVVLWDVDPATGVWSLREALVGHAGDVVDAEVTAGGERLVTAGQDRRLVVWDASADGGFGEDLPGLGDRSPTAPPQVVERGRVAVVPTVPIGASDLLDAPVVDPAVQEPVPVAATFFDPVSGDVLADVDVDTAPRTGWPYPSVSVSPDRGMVAVTTGTATAVLDSSGRRIIATYVPPPHLVPTEPDRTEPATVTCVGWTPDSLMVVCVDDVVGFRIVAVDPRSGQEVRSLAVGLGANAVATDPDNHRLAVTGPAEGIVVVLDTRSFDILKTISDSAISQPAHLSFSPGGRRIAVAGEGGLTVIDTDTWQAVPAPAPLTGDALQAEWFPDGRTVAVTGSDRTVYLYDVEQGHVRALPLPVGGNGSAPDGAVHLLPGISDELVVLGGSLPGRRYPLDPGAWSEFACAVAGRDLTEEEWTRYLPDRPYRPACSDPG